MADSVVVPIPQGDKDPKLVFQSGSLEQNVDEEREANDTSDENEVDAEDDTEEELDGDADSIVGVSIGPAQTNMKSPATRPAAKIQALEASKSYFAAADDQDDTSNRNTVQVTDQPSPKSQPLSNTKADESLPPVSPWQASQTKTGRTSLVSSILGSTNEQGRPRSSSGSSVIENIRKRLPGIPSLSLPKFFDSAEKKQSLPQRPGPQDDGIRGRTASDEHEQRHKPDTRPGFLRRATSDQSLYLKRVATGMSDFDDYTAFSNVSDMVNSRLKAVTDSFQDSNLRLPKFSSIGGASNNQSRRVSSETRPYTNMAGKESAQGNEMEPIVHPNDAAIKNSKHPTFKSALRRMTGDLVVMGGYRGSILREAEEPHRQLWVPVKVGMNLRKADLEVGLTREDELRMHEKIISDGTLSHIGPIDISRRMLKKIGKSPNARNGTLRLHDYGYDWRLSPDLLSDRLIHFLEKLPCNAPGVPRAQRGAWLVAHSLGGLITRHAVNRRPELFAGVVYAGTPQNCVNILGPMRNGDDVLFSSRVLTAQVNFTLRTSFALLPQNGRCFINRETGERYDIDFFDAETWDEHRLSPCIKAPLQRNQPGRSSILPSLSEVRSQSGKRNSWFGSLTGETRDPDEGPAQKAKHHMEDAKHEVEGAAAAAKPEKPLAPNMHDGSAAHRAKQSVATQSTIPLPAAEAYLKTTLASVLEFKQNLTHLPELQEKNAYPPCSIIFAKNTPTVYGAFVASRDAIKYDDAFEDLAFAAGDGVVLASAAQLPHGYRCVRNGRVESDRGHIGLLGDLECIGQCLHALMDARTKGVGMGAYQDGRTSCDISKDSVSS